MSADRAVRLTLRYLVLTLLALIVLFPIYVTVVNSLLPGADITARPPKLFPSNPQWHAYADAWSDGHLGTYLKNSVIVTAFIMAGQLLFSILAGYAFAFLEFPFKRTLFVVFLATLMVPLEVTFVANLTTVTDLGLYDTYAGLAIPFLATGFFAWASAPSGHLATLAAAGAASMPTSAAPASRATATTVAPKRERRGAFTLSSFHGAGAESAHQLLLEDQQEHDKRQGGDHYAGERHVDVIDVGVAQLLESDLNGAEAIVFRDDERPQVLAPCR